MWLQMSQEQTMLQQMTVYVINLMIYEYNAKEFEVIFK